MSIASEITRLQGVKADILTAIGNKGVTVPAGSALDDCPGLIASIDDLFGSVVIGGRTYKTIKIGNFEIMAENLDAEFSGISHENASEDSRPICCYYNNGDSATYGLDGIYGLGLLYNGYAAIYIETNKQTLLPEGWGIATVNVFNALIGVTGYSGINGAKGISIGNLDWAPYWNGDNVISFNAKPGGNRNFDAEGFINFGEGVRFMTSTPSSQFYYNLRDNAFELPTNGEYYSFYSYIRLYRMINQIV